MHKLKRMLGPLRNNADWAQNHLSVTLSMCQLGALATSRQRCREVKVPSASTFNAATHVAVLAAPMSLLMQTAHCKLKSLQCNVHAIMVGHTGLLKLSFKACLLKVAKIV